MRLSLPHHAPWGSVWVRLLHAHAHTHMHMCMRAHTYTHFLRRFSKFIWALWLTRHMAFPTGARGCQQD